MSEDKRISAALDVACQFGGFDGAHHKMWVIDQMVRCLTGCPMVIMTDTDVHSKVYEYEALGESDEYKEWVRAACEGEDGPNTYEWDEGIPP